jgi:methionyl aminopeptidase
MGITAIPVEPSVWVKYPASRQLIDVTKECLMLGVDQCFGGNRLNNVGYEITKHAKQFGYSVVFEFCGHGVGIKFHEEPEVQHCIYRPNEGPVLKPGYIFTVEPMINAGKSRVKIDKKDGWTARTLDGKLSAQFEHAVLITSGAPEILTLRKINPQGLGRFASPLSTNFRWKALCCS